MGRGTLLLGLALLASCAGADQAKGIGPCPSGFYNPDLNAHFLHVAGDSDGNGVMWVYRSKK
jgi:hypothetical protein